ncbi:MAG: hypothetical protein JWR15_1042 [Prosthecobacter sp.]|nr:hypothetical protein [Prosthecobacter sp.]
MKTTSILTLAVYGIFALSPCMIQAEDTVEKVNALLKKGKEVAWVIDGTLNADDEDLAVLFTARAKGTKPSGFPTIISDDVPVVETDAVNDEVCTQGNAVALLVEKRVVGRVKLPNPEEAEVFFPGRNHGSLNVLWGPEEDGWNFGVLIYGAKWDSREVILIETGAGFMQTSIKSQLDASALKFISASKAAKGEDAANYAISYSPEGVVKPAAKYKVGDPITVKIGFGAEVPKGDAPLIEGTLSVLLETSEDKITAKVLKVLPAAQ